MINFILKIKWENLMKKKENLKMIFLVKEIWKDCCKGVKFKETFSSLKESYVLIITTLFTIIRTRF